MSNLLKAYKDIDLAEAPATAALAKYTEEGGVSLEDTVQQFIRPAQTASQKDDKQATKDELWEGWWAILRAACNTPADEQDKLVEFVQTLREQKLQGQGWDGKETVYKDLPTFGWEVREAFNYSPKDPKATEESKVLWYNLNGFLARLTSLSKENAGNEVLDFSMFGLWSLRDGVEDDAPEETPGNGALRAAAVWMLYASKSLWKLSQDSVDLPDNSGKPGFSYKGRDWKGFSMERWTVWKKELANASAQVSDSDVAGLLSDAGMQMGEAETSQSS